jgi:hypothetical protein
VSNGVKYAGHKKGRDADAPRPSFTIKMIAAITVPERLLFGIGLSSSDWPCLRPLQPCFPSS